MVYYTFIPFAPIWDNVGQRDCLLLALRIIIPLLDIIIHYGNPEENQCSHATLYQYYIISIYNIVCFCWFSCSHSLGNSIPDGMNLVYIYIYYTETTGLPMWVAL